MKFCKLKTKNVTTKRGAHPRASFSCDVLFCQISRNLSNAQQSCEPATALDGMKIIDVGELALKFDYKIDVDERVY